MISLSLDRDQSRQIQAKWLPYLVQLCQVKVRDATNDDELMMARLAGSIIDEIVIMFNKKLDNQANKFEFIFKDHHAAIVYTLFLQLPLDPADIFLCNLRTHITTVLHKHLLQIR